MATLKTLKRDDVEFIDFLNAYMACGFFQSPDNFRSPIEYALSIRTKKNGK
jgi:hypothetical protein